MNIEDKSNHPSKYHSISCESFETFIVDYIDGNLQDEQKHIFIQHLNECPACRVYLKNYEYRIQLSKSIFANDTDKPDIPNQLVEAILAAKKQRD
ncbi:anti-sigma factor family protein [Psychromonas sp. L1A2]|uniref:anti-sigma factor family protein n=1 Tax=Psychromonas sp. L1A2 TaxID=2686356 RepID=UPI00135C78B1|nr:zf-HC2 domain-containing protein [Psychromonas sp. L1A2]